MGKWREKVGFLMRKETSMKVISSKENAMESATILLDTTTTTALLSTTSKKARALCCFPTTKNTKDGLRKIKLTGMVNGTGRMAMW